MGSYLRWNGNIWTYDSAATGPQGVTGPTGVAGNATEYVIVDGGVQGVLGAATGPGQLSDQAATNDIVLKASNTNNLILSAQNATGAILFTNGASDTTKVIINNLGNVGIGTSIPNHPLDVNGTTRSTDLIVSNSVGFSVPYYVGYKNTVQSCGTVETLYGWTEEKSNGTWTNNTSAVNDYWRVPRNGLYKIAWNVSWSSSTSAKETYIQIGDKLSTSVRYGSIYLTGNTFRLASSCIVYITTTDNIYLFVQHNSGGNLNVPINTNNNLRCDIGIAWTSD